VADAAAPPPAPAAAGGGGRAPPSGDGGGGGGGFDARREHYPYCPLLRAGAVAAAADAVAAVVGDAP